MKRLSIQRLRERAERILRRVASVHLWAAESLHPSPVPLAYWHRADAVLRKLLPVSNPLAPFDSWLKSDPDAFQDAELRATLHEQVLAGWALDGATLEWLWMRLLLEQPRCVIECGAGVSTLMIASALRSRARPTSGRLVTLEQNESEQRRVSAELASRGLADTAVVLHAPVDAEGAYRVDPVQLMNALAGARADWIVIDGPAGAPGSRFESLVRLQPFCHERARWFLDDSLRSMELGILKRWSQLPGVDVSGLVPIGKGLATGFVSPRAASS